MLRFILFFFFLPCMLTAQIKVPMKAEAWQVGEPEVKFEEHLGSPAMLIHDNNTRPQNNNVFQAKGVTFRNGTIEYDVDLTKESGFVSCYFRMRDIDDNEHVYLRAFFVDDPKSSGGIQYAAVVKGVNYWDISFPYQTGVKMNPPGQYNHVKIVVRDRQLLTYVNDMNRPALYIPIMDGEEPSGGLAFFGKAWIANVTYTPDATENLSAGAGYDPTHNDVRYIRDWQRTEPVEFPLGKEPVAADLPTENTSFTPITAERYGLVNLSRLFGLSDKGRRLVWLKTTLSAKEAMNRVLRLGISDEAYLYLNGRPLYMGKNLYNTPAMMAPRGRATPENVSINLALQDGDNELLIGVANNFFGWGIIAQLNDGSGLRY